jgi:hypothetical protein
LKVQVHCVGTGETMKSNGFEYRVVIVGCMKISIVIVRYVKVKIGPTGTILINDIGQW